MLILLGSLSSIKDMRRRRSTSPGNFVVILCDIKNTGTHSGEVPPCVTSSLYIFFVPPLVSLLHPSVCGWCRRWSADVWAAVVQTWRQAIVPEPQAELCGWYTRRSDMWCPRPGYWYTHTHTSVWCKGSDVNSHCHITLPHFVPFQFLYIHQDPHQLRNGQSWVGVIQLNGHLREQESTTKE